MASQPFGARVIYYSEQPAGQELRGPIAVHAKLLLEDESFRDSAGERLMQDTIRGAGWGGSIGNAVVQLIDNQEVTFQVPALQFDTFLDDLESRGWYWIDVGDHNSFDSATFESTAQKVKRPAERFGARICAPGEIWVDNPQVTGGGYCRAKPGEGKHKHKQYKAPKLKKQVDNKKPQINKTQVNEFNPEEYGLEKEDWDNTSKESQSKIRKWVGYGITIANAAPAAAKMIAEEAGAPKSVAISAYWFATIGDFAIPMVPVASLAVAAISSAINPKASLRAWIRGREAYRKWKEGRKKAASITRVAAMVFEESKKDKKFDKQLAMDIAREASRHSDPQYWLFVFAAAYDDLHDYPKAIEAADAVLGRGGVEEE